MFTGRTLHPDPEAPGLQPSHRPNMICYVSLDQLLILSESESPPDRIILPPQRAVHKTE